MYRFECLDCDYHADNVDDVILTMEWHFHHVHGASAPVRPATLVGENGGPTHVINTVESSRQHGRHLRVVPDSREQSPYFT